jgi:hypothetical protein
MRLYLIIISLVILTLSACQKPQNAEQIVSKAIEYAGGDKFEHSTIAFDFRDKYYQVKREIEDWEMVRSFQDSNKLVEDLYSTEVFERKINGEKSMIVDSMQFKYIESINSVIYFALLPYKLNDKAVIKELLGKEEIEENTYYKVKVRFREEGGGEDFQDEFIYWFDVKDYSLDYLAYSFQVNGGGMRFRKAYNERFVEGIRFADYVNYKPTSDNADLTSLAQMLEEEKLKELSRIELDNISVTLKPS